MELYDSKVSLPNKLLQEDGTITDITGKAVVDSVEAYKSKPALPNKFLNPNGTYSTLNEIISSMIDTDLFIVVDELPASGDEQKIYLVPDGEGGFTEYHWTGDTWDPIGTIEIDLSDYVKNTDYATSQKGGTIKIGNGSGTDILNGVIRANIYGYNVYPNVSDNAFIGKKTLENVINNSIILTGSNAPTTSTVGYRVGQLYLNSTTNEVYQLIGINASDNTYTWQKLIRDTDYASSQKGGVFKGGNGIYTSANGQIYIAPRTLAQYQTDADTYGISKGTLENVITGKELINQTQLTNAIQESITQVLGGSY